MVSLITVCARPVELLFHVHDDLLWSEHLARPSARSGEMRNANGSPPGTNQLHELGPVGGGAVQLEGSCPDGWRNSSWPPTLTAQWRFRKSQEGGNLKATPPSRDFLISHL